MKTPENKRLVMIGIRRKGEKGFKTQIRKDSEVPLKAVLPIDAVLEPTHNKESSTQ
jgi:hypothetical protein